MAYASVASLMRTMGLVLASNSPMKPLIGDHREEFLALHEKVSFLEAFLKNFEKINNSGKMTDLEAQIKELANVVEHTIQLRLTELVATSDELQIEKIRERLFQSLKYVAKEFDRVQKESSEFQDKGKQALKESLVQDSSSKKHTPNVENNMVGRDNQRNRMLAELKGYGGFRVIPIVGMGGIGKTTLAKEVYNDASIRLHFDVRSWATVSQQHNVKEILLSLLRSTKGDTFNMDSEKDLADMLQKSLKGKRYLIVLDDMWKNEAWDGIRLCFPSENNGSRILLTTRNTEVACSAGTGSVSLQMGLMGPDESWNLFESIASFNKTLPSEFGTIGKQIVDKCHGLPLTIVVVAGLLNSKRTIEYWENVAKNVKSITNDPDKQCLNVLGSSYNDLTSDLKACLLYFGIFPEDSEISVKRLVRLWMAEGFLKFEEDLEGEAEKCLQELVDRCLVLISRKSLDETKIRSCKVHDLIYDLCLREVQRGNVFLMNDIVFEESDAIKAQSQYISLYDCEPNHVPSESQSLSRMQPFKCSTLSDCPYDLYRALLTPEHHQLTDDDNNNLLKRTRSIFFSGFYSTFILKSELTHFKLLKVLDLSRIDVEDNFPLQVLSLIWLRYLSLGCNSWFDIPPEICRLWNLQTFIVEGPGNVTVSERIWGLMQLRHLKLPTLILQNPPTVSVGKERRLDISNIQTISYLSVCCCTKEVILGIQNVKKLGICGSFQKSDGLLNNLVHLHQLESLSLKWYFWSSGISPATIPSAKAFPATLKKLKLAETKLSWSDLDIIAELPNLEVLKLMYTACDGKEWYPIVRGFTRLKLLLIHDNDLKYWKAINDNFPVLERLVIRDCPHLDEIPIEFADIYTLQLIEIKDCTPELEASIARIQQEQEDLGNKPVDIRILNRSRS